MNFTNIASLEEGDDMNKKVLLHSSAIIGLIFIASIVSAAPVIQILSPENITYSTTKILVNVTSNESVDFFSKDSRGIDSIFAENVTSFESFIYAKNGSYTFEIWANNSGGETNESIAFSTTEHNPIEISSCGYLYSSDTEYILVNDISTISWACLGAYYLKGISLNLNGHSINRGTSSTLRIMYGSDIEIYNGTLNSSASTTRPGYATPRVIEVYGSKIRFRDLYIHGHIGVDSESLDNSLFENVTINSTIGFLDWYSQNVYFINSSFIWNGVGPSFGICPYVNAICGESLHSTIILENTTVEDFPEYDFDFEDSSFTDVYLRNSELNLSKVKFPENIATLRFINQHLIIVNVSDQFNESGSGVIEVIDNGVLPRVSGIDALVTTISNPTSNFLIATDENGTTSFWLTENLYVASKSSPLVITEYDFSLYNLTARSWESQATAELNLTDVNSIIPVSIQLEIGGTYEECTIADMLDLNNDEVVNIQDATLILRKIAGLPVSSAGSKECTGINLNPF